MVNIKPLLESRQGLNSNNKVKTEAQEGKDSAPDRWAPPMLWVSDDLPDHHSSRDKQDIAGPPEVPPFFLQRLESGLLAPHSQLEKGKSTPDPTATGG